MSVFQRQATVNTIRTTQVWMRFVANSGHPWTSPGANQWLMFLGLNILKVNPKFTNDRDRFVLSAGHGSAMLYALLHLS